MNFTPPCICLFACLSISAESQAHYEQLDENANLPSCETVADDPDGDGYGWTPHAYGAHSCIVDENTYPRPLYSRVGENLQPINLIRTYWDPNADFAGKEIECTNYRTSTLQDWQPLDTFQITHYSLPNTAPWMGEFEITYQQAGVEYKTTNVWRSANGSYFGSMHYYNPDDFIGFFANHWGEPIEIDGQQGMRFWMSSSPLQGEPETISGNLYQDCKYTSGLAFRPTGNWDSAQTPSVNAVPDIPLLNPGPSEYEKPVFVNRSTGESVELNSFSWNIANDLLYKTIHCDDRYWEGGYYDSFYSEADHYIFMPPLPGKSSGNLYLNNRGDTVRYVYEWSIEDGQLTTTGLFPPAAGWYETLTSDDGTQSVRIWGSDDSSYDDCWHRENRSSRQTLLPTGAVEGNNPEDNSTPIEPIDDGNTGTDNSNQDSEVGATTGGGGGVAIHLLALLILLTHFRCKIEKRSPSTSQKGHSGHPLDFSCQPLVRTSSQLNGLK